ncbi:MAG: stage II sporulation protein M [Vicinamibacterales bacterium]
MISTHWLNQRTPHWRRLEDLVARAERRGLRALTHAELQDIGVLYRQVATDLATVREHPSSARFATHLNQLLGRAHHTIYAAGGTAGSSAWAFLSRGFPSAVRSHLVHIALATGVFVVGALIGGALTRTTPGFAAKVIGPEMVATIARHEMWTHSIVAIKPMASSQIMTNNMSVAFMTFAAGITAGMGTLYLLAFNGLMIGVIATACSAAGMSVALWSFVAPHGVLELPAIFIAGAAGLRLAQGLLFPGLLPRLDSLGDAGRDAVRLVAGCVPILIVAGVIEAFVSPTDLAVFAKLSVAGALFVLLAAYVFVPRRRAS